MKKHSLLKLIISMVIFGTIGIFVRYIDAERGFIAFTRGIIGAIILVVALLLMRRRPSLTAIKNNLVWLLISGACIGINWILLFESYSYTTIATSTLCYYMSPVFVIIASPLVLGARVTAKKWICVVVALVGMVLVSGIVGGDGIGENGIIGVALALGAALLYATVTLLNKKLKDISSYDTTIVQLAAAALTVLPYTIFAESNDIFALDPVAIIMILVVGVLHTGVAYMLFFSSIQELPTETVALFSYLDPIVAVLLSLFISEPMTLPMCIGAVLIIVALIASEVDLKRLFGIKK